MLNRKERRAVKEVLGKIKEKRAVKEDWRTLIKLVDKTS
jgi:hypothetical protein